MSELRDLSLYQTAHLFLFVCSASNIQNISLMYSLTATYTNLMNRFLCTQASQGVNDAAGSMESKQTFQTYEPAWKQQTPCKKESRQRQRQKTSALNTQEYFHCPALSSSPWPPCKAHRAAVLSLFFPYRNELRFKKVAIGAGIRGKAQSNFIYTCKIFMRTIHSVTHVLVLHFKK